MADRMTACQIANQLINMDFSNGRGAVSLQVSRRTERPEWLSDKMVGLTGDIS
jgi:hypothetical protein